MQYQKSGKDFRRKECQNVKIVSITWEQLNIHFVPPRWSCTRQSHLVFILDGRSPVCPIPIRAKNKAPAKKQSDCGNAARPGERRWKKCKSHSALIVRMRTAQIQKMRSFSTSPISIFQQSSSQIWQNGNGNLQEPRERTHTCCCRSLHCRLDLIDAFEPLPPP